MPNPATLEVVRSRAGGRCEYCRLPDVAAEWPFLTDHIIARKHLGSDALGHLAYACAHCNLHKGTDFRGIDRIGRRKKVVALFDPRRHRWDYHFRWDGPVLAGKTAIGRVTIQVLNMNDSLVVDNRAALIEAGLFP